jgi:hypothetical protein
MGCPTARPAIKIERGAGSKTKMNIPGTYELLQTITPRPKRKVATYIDAFPCKH